MCAGWGGCVVVGVGVWCLGWVCGAYGGCQVVMCVCVCV